jgi:hypothetical protein
MMRRVITLSCMVAACAAWAGEPGESLGRTLTTLARMERENLAAAHEAAKRYNEQRVEIESRTPHLTDYRAVFHAHAEDASHTGGTRPEMLADAKTADVHMIWLSNHIRPPTDFIDDSWRGLRDGVLFVPGAEETGDGLLLYPMESMMDVLGDGREALIERATQGDGMAFLSHIEDRFDAPMEGFTGMEIYNRHADAKDDMILLMSLMGQVTDPEKAADLEARLADYPDEVLAVQLDYPELYMEKWDATLQQQRVVGVAANDCHHNQVFIVTMVDENTVLVGTNVDKDEDMRKLTAEQFPSIPELTQGHEPGDELVRLDFDPYHVSFHNVSTHVLSEALNEDAARDAVLSGHAYVAHDWMCDPTGFQYLAYHGDPNTDGAEPAAMMGDEIEHAPDLRLYAEFPVECHIRLLKDGEVIVDTNARTLTHEADSAGVYRIEGWLEVNTEDRVWIYSNPIYVR